jgi:hypothetical protein
MRASVLLFAASTLFAAAAPQPPTPINVHDFVHADTPNSTTVQDPAAPVSFELPAAWALASGVRWGDHETTLQIRDTVTGIFGSIYYQYPIQSAIPSDLDAALAAAMALKVRQRQEKEGLKDYHVRAGSPQSSVVDGRLALSFIGDFTARGGKPMSEYLLKVLGTNGKAEFFVKVPATLDLASFETSLNSIAHSLHVP